MAKMMNIRTTITLVDSVGEHAPGEEVSLPADEARGILDRFGGEEVVEKVAAKGKGDPEAEAAAKKAADEAAAKKAAEEAAAKKA